MNREKQNKKLVKLGIKADDCVSRENAQKIIKKADKVYEKLSA
tara:strand:+ start:596 stop:724 length:129 start_codon:yes stop_codon:yes gene_type:complete